MLRHILSLAVAISLIASGAFAQNAQDNLNTLESDVLDCAAKYDDQGNIKSIKCQGEAEMSFADAKGIRIAKQQAVLRAKANMAKFMNEHVQSREAMEDITKTLSEKTGQSESVARKAAETLTEQVSSQADAMLKGVTIIQTDADQKNKTVVVQIGANRQTMLGADQLKGHMEKRLDQPGNNSAGTVAGSSSDGSARTVKKTKNYGEF